MENCMFTPCPMQLAGVRKKTLVVDGTCGHVSACSLLSGCVLVFLNMWVHACFCCAIHKKRWALIRWCDILCLLVIVLVINSHHSPHPTPMSLPFYPLDHHPPCPLSQATTIGGGPPLSILGARRLHQQLARDSANSVCLRARRLTMFLQDLTPGLTPTLFANSHTSLPHPFRPHCSTSQPSLFWI